MIHLHKWRARSAMPINYRRWNYIAQAYDREINKTATEVLYKCDRCPKAKVMEFDGHWELNHFQ